MREGAAGVAGVRQAWRMWRVWRVWRADLQWHLAVRAAVHACPRRRSLHQLTRAGGLRLGEQVHLVEHSKCCKLNKRSKCRKRSKCGKCSK